MALARTLPRNPYEQIDGNRTWVLLHEITAALKHSPIHWLAMYPASPFLRKALEATSPNAFAISTYTDSHDHYVSEALKWALHIFVEKPLAETIRESLDLSELANRMHRKLRVGYILITHPSWNNFTEIAHELGKPLAMRMNLNQQAKGDFYDTLHNIMRV